MTPQRVVLLVAIGLAAVGAGVVARGTTTDPASPSTAAGIATANALTDEDTAPTTTSPVAPGTARRVGSTKGSDPIGEPVPPAVGTYRYRANVNGTASTTTLAVLAASAPTPATVRQVERHLVDGRWVNDIVDWTHDGAAIVATSSAAGRCTYDRPATIVPAHLAVGVTWEVHSSCTTVADGERVTLTRLERAEVRHRTRTTFDGRPIETWFVARTATETETRATSTITATASSTELFAPSLGVVVYRLSRTDLPGDDGSVASIASSLELLTFTGHEGA